MPELPEVETVVLGLRDHLVNQYVLQVDVYHSHLRHPIQKDLSQKLTGNMITSVSRRAKYIIIHLKFDLVIHLGMSGKLLKKDLNAPIIKHDHIVLTFKDMKLVYNDPRRFGMFYWCDNGLERLQHLGIEPLFNEFTALYLFERIRNRPIKVNIMDQRIVVGVGNIYAAEALYQAGILPTRTQLRIKECERLVFAIKAVLRQSIELGGSSLKDYRGVDNNLGYFQQKLCVYDQRHCPKGHLVQNLKLSGRSSYYCAVCQV
jgi:formamidopyrimidine-DNA glycosylase